MLDELRALFDGPGAGEYLGEAVSIGEHMRQAGALARAAGAPGGLVAAALLHDVGHLLQCRARRGAELPDPRIADARHGTAGADWLATWLPPAVTEPVRLHVPAKRYLCATEPGYSRLLSPESVRTLALQGGPMTAGEAAEFAAGPYAADAVEVRRWDDQAKDPAVTPPPFAAFTGLLTALASAWPGASTAR